MRNSTFKTLLRNTYKKEPATKKDNGSFNNESNSTEYNRNNTIEKRIQMASCESHRTNDSNSTHEEQDDVKEIFSDVSVCNYLGIRRRTLNAARTKESKGKAWDIVGEHAGMTMAWIDEFALNRRGNPNFNAKLERIMQKDGVTSVRMKGTTPHPCIVIVERLSDGKRMFAQIRNIMQYPIMLNDCFDAITNNGKLEWFEKGNSVKY